ncbi:ABC transporter substrate-binding protein [Gracilibacillus massiliensis]|uniref:ABC transporter substrate-binding protein n=1 Tax=Gracilibacillus massiliensis TaxID=1564956 RepID=UPI00071DBFCA|nr:extracellular solute-binding protein [Gracilibacillus massiliensis]
MKKFLLLLVTISMIFWLAACSSSEGSNEQDNQTSNNEEDSNNQAEESEDEEITLRFAWWGEQNRANYTLEVIELFEEQNPNVTIEAEYASWDDYWRKLAPQAAAGELPDIIQMDLSYISEYSANNQITDLTPFIGEEINVDNIADSVISGGEVNGGIHGFNVGTTASSFFYNPAIAEEIGVELSEDWTWDDFEEIAKTAAEEGYEGGAGVSETQVSFDYYLRTKGQKLFAEDGSGLAYDDDQLFVDYFTMQKELVDLGAGPTPDEVAQQTGPEDSSLVKGEGLGGIGWATQFPGTQELTDLDLSLTNPPAASEDTKGLYLKPSMLFSIAENSNHKEMAAKFIDFFVNDVEANKLIMADRGIPVSSVIKEELSNEVPDAQAQVFDYISWVEENSSPMGGPDPSGAGEVISALQRLAEQIIYGEVTPDEAAEDFRVQAESILGSN